MPKPAATTTVARTVQPFGWPFALVGAWTVPWLAVRVGASALLPAMIIGGLMLVQRGARTWLDRFVVSLVQAFGTLCIAGLLYSVWPWHLEPVAVSGPALTVLVLAWRVRSGVVPRVRPAWGTDLPVLLATAGTAALVLVPFGLRDVGSRLGIVMPGEDFARHLVLTDVIGRVGGYAFLRAGAAAAYLPDSIAVGIRNYPQGVHLGYAVLIRFLHGAPTATDGAATASLTLWLLALSYAFLALAVLWGVRRLAGPGPGTVRVLAVLAVAGAWLFFGDPLAVFLRGYPNQLVGLALCAVLTAIVARPLADRRDQILTVAALVVGVSFSYHLFLPYALTATALWAWPAGARLVRDPVALAAAAVVLPAAALTPLLNRQAATASHLGSAGTALLTDRVAIGALVLLAVIALLARHGWRSVARRRGTGLLGAALAIMAGLAAVQLATVGQTVYYFEKTLHLTVIVALVLLGGAARLLPRHPVRAAVPALAVIVVVASLGGPWHLRPGSLGVRFAAGLESGSSGGGRDAFHLARLQPDGGDAVNLDLTEAPYRNWLGTLFASALQRNYRYGHDWYGFLNPRNPPRTLEDLTALVAASPVPVRIYVRNPKASMLVLDPRNPKRVSEQPGGDPAAFGAAGALTNIEAAEYLARRFPGRVTVVRL